MKNSGLQYILLFLLGPCYFPLCAEVIDYKKVLTESEVSFAKAHKLALYQTKEAKELYLKTALKLELLIPLAEKYKINKSKLCFNAANAFYFADHIGKSLFYLRLAEELRPGDLGIRQHLKELRDKRADQLPEIFHNEVIDFLSFHKVNNDILKSALILSLLLLFGIIVRISVLSLPNYVGKREDNRSLNKRIMSALLVLFLFLSTVYIMRVISQNKRSDGVIINSQVIARKGDSYVYSEAFVQPLHEGTEFKVLEKREEWTQVQLSNQETCWLPNKAIKLLQ